MIHSLCTTRIKPSIESRPTEVIHFDQFMPRNACHACQANRFRKGPIPVREQGSLRNFSLRSRRLNAIVESRDFQERAVNDGSADANHTAKGETARMLRRREPAQAAIHGTRQAWGALPSGHKALMTALRIARHVRREHSK